MISGLLVGSYGLFRRVLVVLLVLGSMPVQGAPMKAGAAEQHYNRGLAYYESKDYPNAIREFQAAYKIRQLPRILLNIGQVYRKLGMASTALRFYEHYLRVEPKPKPEIKQEVDRYIAMTRAMLDPPPFEPVDTLKAKAAAAAEVAAAPSNVTQTQQAAADPLDIETAGRPTESKPLTVVAIAKEKSTVDGKTPAETPTTAGHDKTEIGTATPPLSSVSDPKNRVTLVPKAGTEDIPAQKPFYKQPLFWGVVGGLSAAVLITGIAVGVSQSNSTPATILYPTK